MKHIREVSFLLFTLLFSTTAYSASCNGEEQDKAEYFSKKAGKKVVAGYGGGQDIVVNAKSCKYNSYSKEFEVKVEIYWNGAFYRSEKYNSDGVLTMSFDGENYSYGETYRNKNLKNTAEGMDFANLFGTLVAKDAAQGNSTKGFIVVVKSCFKQDMDIFNVAVRYMDIHGTWQSGWWKILPQTTVTLHSNGSPIRTKNSVTYFYGENIAYNGNISGEYSFDVAGGYNSLKMKKNVDKVGAANINIGC